MKKNKNIKLAFGIIGLVLLVVGIVAGYRVLQGPIDLRNRASEGGGACFEEYYPEVKCIVTYKLTKEVGSPPPAQGKAYILNEAGEKVPFNNGTQDEQQIQLKGTGDQPEDYEIVFNNVSNESFFADPNEDGTSETTCKIEELVVPDKCCKIPETGEIAESCLGEGEDKAFCERRQISPICEEEEGCSCKDLFGETDIEDEDSPRRNAAIKENPYGNITLFPEYKDGPKDGSFVEGEVVIKNKQTEKFKVNCINCSYLYSEIETDAGNAFITLTPYMKERADGELVCIDDKENQFNKKGEQQNEPDEFYFRFRCNQAKNGSGPGAADTARVTRFRFENEKPHVKWLCSEEDPEPTITYEEETCKWGCEARCPACPNTGEQPMMSGVKARTAGGEWEILDGVTCQDLEPVCNFGFRKFGTGAKDEPPEDFRLGNETKDLGPPKRGEDPNGLTNQCYSAGDRIFLDTVSDAGDLIGWDYVDFGRGGPVPPTPIPSDNGSVSYPYEDPGTYDISQTCSVNHPDEDTTDSGLDLSAYDEVQCIKRIVVSCGGGTPPGGGTIPPPGPPGNPGPDPEPKACYDECEVGTDTCGTSMQCVDHDTNPATPGKCVVNPDNDCADLDEPNRQACYCNELSPSPTPTPGDACRVNVAAQCVPLVTTQQQ